MQMLCVPKHLAAAMALAALAALSRPAAATGGAAMDLTRAVIVTRGAAAPELERTAAAVLAEEAGKRTGCPWRVAARWPRQGWAVAVTSGQGSEVGGRRVPVLALTATAEGYGLATDLTDAERPILWVYGADPRGALFGVGKLLRTLEMRKGSATLPAPLDLTTAPAYPIRGHQLGYRATANSYDAWTPAQYDQYIRDLALFGCSSVEGIPGHDARPTVNPYPRDKMNVDISRICARYGQDYWVWTPADFDLNDSAKRAEALARLSRFFDECPELTGVFVPGGDPGSNPPGLVIPYLRDLAGLLARAHPRGRVWASMQGFEPEDQAAMYRWIADEKPAWLGGIAAGPGSPTLADIRARLPKSYPIRDYPDITHTVRCQFPVPWIDPVFAFTLGREGVNPRPLYFSRVIRDTMPFTDGFISYSDGCHDDVNKVIWSALAWDPKADLHAILGDYARLFFGPDVAEGAAAGIAAFERSWDGSLADNGGVDANHALWSALDRRAPGLRSNWRWQLCQLRADYDLYTRKRLIFERGLEQEANAALLGASATGVQAATDAALAALRRADTHRVRPDLSGAVEGLCEALWRSVGLQTSVAKYKASGSERGAVLDFLYYPLNNRWWLEDELAKVKALPTEAARVARLRELATWENPGPGSFYDDIGNVARSPHEVRNERLTAPILDADNTMVAGFMWWTGDSPLARSRQSWISSEDWPAALKYVALDREAEYLIRTTGCGQCLVRVNGVRLTPTRDGRAVGDVKEFPVPRGLTAGGAITVTFDKVDEPGVNWRLASRLTEIWLIKR
ncbi:MAG: hypothetical protein NT029_02305 [Armatimonadetes bacterium]|nr:hypothetical protein [Armatimonadota bacterium]